MKKCPLCEREGDALVLQAHHLQTRRKDGKDTELICRSCHKTIHGLFTNTQLRDPRSELDSVEGLQANERFAKALKHIKKLAPGEFMKMREAKTKRRRR